MLLLHLTLAFLVYLEMCQNSAVRKEHSTNIVADLSVWASHYLALLKKKKEM